MSRPARVDDIEEIALALPRAEKVAGWGGRPAYQVSRKLFCGFRSPRPDALGELGRDELTEVLVDAWRTCAPKTVVKAYDEEHPASR